VQSKLEHDRILRPKAAAQLIGVAKASRSWSSCATICARTRS